MPEIKGLNSYESYDELAKYLIRDLKISYERWQYINAILRTNVRYDGAVYVCSLCDARCETLSVAYDHLVNKHYHIIAETVKEFEMDAGN